MSGMADSDRIVVVLAGLDDISSEELRWIREFLRPWGWAVPHAKVGWSAQHRWIVLSFASTGDLQQALDLIGNAVNVSAQVPPDRDLEAFVVDVEPADVRSKRDFAARPKRYHFGSVVLTDADAEMLLSEHEIYEIGRRDLPLRTLQRDRDSRFRPVQELGAARKLDRPIVPLLNALVACGCQPYASCAGHLNMVIGTRAISDGNPYVMLDATSRAAAVARSVAAHFDGWRTQTTVRRGGRGLVLRLGDGSRLEERQRPRSLDERRALDARLVEAAAALEPASFAGFRVDEPSEGHRLLARIGYRSDVDWVQGVPAAMVGHHEFKEPIVDDQGARVAPLAVINELGPVGGCELRLMNYDVGERWLDALIKADSFAALTRVIDAAIPSIA